MTKIFNKYWRDGQNDLNIQRIKHYLAVWLTQNSVIEIREIFISFSWPLLIIVGWSRWICLYCVVMKRWIVPCAGWLFSSCRLCSRSRCTWPCWRQRCCLVLSEVYWHHSLHDSTLSSVNIELCCSPRSRILYLNDLPEYSKLFCLWYAVWWLWSLLEFDFSRLSFSVISFCLCRLLSQLYRLFTTPYRYRLSHQLYLVLKLGLEFIWLFWYFGLRSNPSH